MSCEKKSRLDDEGVNAEGPGGDDASAGAGACSAEASTSRQTSDTTRALRERHREIAPFPETRFIVHLLSAHAKQLI